jgi:hypothetical protein
MLILIEKDSATRIPREVRDLEEAQGVAVQGFTVHVQQPDGSTLPLSDALAAQEAQAEAEDDPQQPQA